VRSSDPQSSNAEEKEMLKMKSFHLCIHYFPAVPLWKQHGSREAHQKTSERIFQDGGQREKTESMPPVVKSWKDTGDTPCR
jgi:hypothetical protein